MGKDSKSDQSVLSTAVRMILGEQAGESEEEAMEHESEEIEFEKGGMPHASAL